MFERMRERKGHVYVDTYDETKRLIEQMKNYKAPEEDGSDDYEQKNLELAEEHKRNMVELEDMRKEIEDQHGKLVEEAVEKHIQKCYYVEL
ncbi:hypothetical protein Tco_1018918 [Tanacetum coccineum]|uniref:Uncharacterized protein n=1 Tax=Tanacetum coccineum TaxID=301880 RepID=A0ABQ5FVR1_9ASTR